MLPLLRGVEAEYLASPVYALIYRGEAFDIIRFLPLLPKTRLQPIHGCKLVLDVTLKPCPGPIFPACLAGPDHPPDGAFTDIHFLGNNGNGRMSAIVIYNEIDLTHDIGAEPLTLSPDADTIFLVGIGIHTLIAVLSIFSTIYIIVNISRVTF